MATSMPSSASVSSSSDPSSSSISISTAVTSRASYRQCLERAVAAILVEAGFDTASAVVVQTMAEMLQAFMYELGRSSRAFTEVACRSEPLPADILLALTEMGQTTVGIKEYAFRTGRRCLSNPGLAQPAKPTSILHTGDRKPRSKLLAEMCPEFPDSHSYLRTPTHKQPVTDYESVREKAASQKRDVERALTRFIAKTGKTHSLFNTDDTNMFPLISCDRIMPDQPVLPPYLNALLFKDQIFEEDEREYAPKKKKEDEDEDEDEEEEAKSKDSPNKKRPGDKTEGGVDAGASEEKKEKKESQNKINNPFLRPVRLPRTPSMIKRKL